MISENNIKAIRKLQIIMEQHGKEISEALKAFHIFSSGMSQSLQSLNHLGIDASKTLAEYKRISEQASKSLKPVYDMMESIKINTAWMRNIKATSFDIAIKNLEGLQNKIINISEVARPIDINPSWLISPLKDDKRIKDLIKEALRELEGEGIKQRKQELEELAKKKKIGFK